MNAPAEPPTGAYSERNNDPASGNLPLLAPDTNAASKCCEDRSCKRLVEGQR